MQPKKLNCWMVQPLREKNRVGGGPMCVFVYRDLYYGGNLHMVISLFFNTKQKIKWHTYFIYLF